MKYKKSIAKIICVENVEEAMTILQRITTLREKKVKLVFHSSLKLQVEQNRCMNLENIVL